MLILALLPLPFLAPKPAVHLTIGILEVTDAFMHKPMERTLRPNGPQSAFGVTIQNTSDRPLRFFTDGSSWGDPTLSFEITLPDGKKVVARKVVSGYGKNTPTQVRLQPGECWNRGVLYVPGSPGSYEGFPIASQAPVTFTLKAIFEQPVYREFKECWAGRVESVPIKVRLSQ